MNQRLSINFTQPEKKYDLSGSFTTAVCLARFMITTHLSETPIQFINNALLKEGLEQAYAYARKLDGNKETTTIFNKLGMDDIEIIPSESKDLIEIMSTLNILAMKQPVASIVAFKETNNCLLVVGQKREFYVIDIANGLFYQTETLEYDIDQYKYGSVDFEAIFLSLKEEQKPSTPKIVVKKEKDKQEKPSVSKKTKTKKDKDEK